MTHGILLAPPLTPREEWLALRRQGIGASDIAAVLDISPWVSPFSLYWQKKLGTETEMTSDMEWGLRLEATIADKFADNHPEYVLALAGLYRHPQHEWMLATPDRIAHREGSPDELVQIKTAYSWDHWGKPGSDQVPVYYRAQVMQEMAVYGALKCWLPVLVGGKDYREYAVEYDKSEIDTIVKSGQEFMAALASDTPPDIDGSSSTTSTLKALHPSLIDEAVTIPMALADAYAVQREVVTDAVSDLNQITNQILDHLGNARTAVSDGRKIALRVVYDQQRLDTKRLREDHPELCEQYAVTSTVSKLVPARENT